jgi:ADP-ribosylglycohydrolase
MDRHIRYFMLGDKIGKHYETGVAYDLSDTRISKEKFLRIADTPDTFGSDESDIVRCFYEFVKNKKIQDDLDKTLWDWCLYLAQNRRATRYGKTWQNFFLLIDYLKKLPDNHKTKLQKIYEISMDANSCGNGAIVLIYPVMKTYETFGNFSEREIKWIIHRYVNLTHHHKEVDEVINLMVDHIKQCKETKKYPKLKGHYHKLTMEEFCRYHPINTTVKNTYMYAVMALHFAEKKENEIDQLHSIMNTCIKMGGDIDSVASVAFLLWSFCK